MSLLAALDRFFATRAPVESGDRLVVGFSGGPDSTALLAALDLWSRDRPISLCAAHLDHGLDSGSAARAHAARRIAAKIGVAFRSERRAVPARDLRAKGLEAAARLTRYRFLEEVRAESGARYIVTGHHLDDQAETVVLRLLQGTGAAGLAAIAPRRGPVVRPLLDLPRNEIARWLADHGIDAVEDQTNRDLTRPRNLVREGLLDALADDPKLLAAQLARLASTARRAARTLDRRLAERLEPRSRSGRVEIARRRLEALPDELHSGAITLLHRRAGATYPPTAASRRELARQLAAGGRVGCDTGGGWRLVSAGSRLRLEHESGRPSPARPFAYTLTLPGEVDLPATAGAFRLRRQQVELWMFSPCSWRAGLSLPLRDGDRITVRSRRPGDRVRPFGCSYDRRLKDVLIDRKIPRRERDRLPLLCIGQRVLWAPGVTIDEGCRLAGGGEAWVAEIER